MENRIDHQVIIIGAGPAGLILGYYLEKQSIDYLILEKNQTAGSSWTQMPEHLRLISHWPSNCLLPEDKKLFPNKMTHKATEFADYLVNFSKRHHLKIKFQTDVLEVSKSDQTFSLKTSSTEYQSKIVVDCRGHFNFPYIPEIEISGNAPLLLHFKDYKNTKQLKDYKKVLIVGKRLSAGQVLNELAGTGTHELFISARSAVKFSSHPIIYNFFLSHLDFIEGLIKKFSQKIKNEIEVPMHYNARFNFEKKAKLKGDILKIEGKDVYFKDGTTESIDAIIFTTGFKPPKVDLSGDFESSVTPNMFYLGRNSQRTFTSRFIRGIREDAQVLADILLSKLASKNNRQ